MMMGGDAQLSVLWLIAMIVLLIIEAVVPGLISIWFALGALAALVAALFHAPFWLQVVWFLVVSILTLLLTRPFVKKYVNNRVTPTNADMVIGKEAVVTEAIDNLQEKGLCAWTERSGRHAWPTRTPARKSARRYVSFESKG